MARTEDVSSSPAEAVRAAVAAAASRRRRREVMRRLWRVAPVVAASCLLVIVATRWAGAARTVPLVAVGVSLAALAGYVYLRERGRASGDAVVARIDDDGGFGGELRSASWFAAKDTRDEWTAFHLDRAAARFSGTDWASLYPAVGAWRARWVTAGCVVAALVLVGTWPRGSTLRASMAVASARARGVAPQDGRPLLIIPPDLRKRIEELLAAAEKGTISPDDKAKALDIYNLFTQINSDIDPEKLDQLAKAMDPEQGGTAGQAAKKLWELAGKVITAADAKGTPEDLRKALEGLGQQLTASAAAEDRKASEGSQSQSASAASGQPGQASDQAASNGAASLDPNSIQLSKDTGAGAAAGMTMLSDMPGQKGQAGGGFGGGGRSGPPPTNGTMPGLADALRHETIEASTDTAGQNVLSETRRQTERGQATVPFTQTAPGTSDRSLAGAPPPVPEDRRATVQSYFTRQP